MSKVTKLLGATVRILTQVSSLKATGLFMTPASSSVFSFKTDSRGHLHQMQDGSAITAIKFLKIKLIQGALGKGEEVSSEITYFFPFTIQQAVLEHLIYIYI